MTVDKFVQSNVLPQFHDVVALVRQLMREEAPEAQELISYGMHAYSLRRIIAVISPTKKDITVSLSRATEFDDRYGLLRGAGKSSKHVKIKSLDTANQEALRDYIRQAVEWDER